MLWPVGGRDLAAKGLLFMPMTAHPAQPDNLPSHQMLLLLTEQIAVLVQVHAQLRDTKPTRKAKDTIMRRLSGVLGSVETIRLALK